MIYHHYYEGTHHYYSIFLAVVFCVLIVINIIKLTEKPSPAKHDTYNDSATIVETPALIVSRRSEVSGFRQAETRYFATFEFETGERIELLVSGLQFGMLAEGDRGQLQYQGTRYLGFSRHR